MATLKLLIWSSCCLSIGLAVLPETGQASAMAALQTSSADSTAPPLPKQAPLYDSDSDLARVPSPAFNTPEADGRPGVYFFDLGAQAVKHKDYAHAIAMYKVAASWAYKPAEYNLAVMYLRGQGTAVDGARALAWMALAAERNDPQYVKARDLINAHLNDAQFKQANVIMAQLLPTFGDKVALTRAERRWQEVRDAQTGSHVGGGAGPLLVGAVANDPNHMKSPNYDVHDGGHVGFSAAEVAGAHQTDGSVAYQQFRESKNPYDPKFERHPDATGTVTVGPLKSVKTGDVKKPDAPDKSSSTDGSNR